MNARYQIQVDPKDEAVVREINTLFRLFGLDAEAKYGLYWEGYTIGPMHLLPFHIEFDNDDKSLAQWRRSLHYASARKLKNAALKLIDLTNAQRQ